MINMFQSKYYSCTSYKNSGEDIVPIASTHLILVMFVRIILEYLLI